jgi:hypothetical protein
MVLGNETEPTDPKKVKSIDDHSEDNSGKTRSVSVGSSEGDREQGEI